MCPGTVRGSALKKNLGFSGKEAKREREKKAGKKRATDALIGRKRSKEPYSCRRLKCLLRESDALMCEKEI